LWSLEADFEKVVAKDVAGAVEQVPGCGVVVNLKVFSIKTGHGKTTRFVTL
jgi:hypothetical protein